MSKLNLVKKILQSKLGEKPKKSSATAFAPANIALCKYWGKKNVELHLPCTDSISLSLGNKGSITKISVSDKDSITLNNKLINLNDSFSVRLFNFINLFRLSGDVCFSVEIKCNLPIAAGLASSAAGFAAITLALNNLYMWDLNKIQLSILARIGSGSACRSVYNGFVRWYEGTHDLNSYAEKLPYIWNELRFGLLINTHTKKSISSAKAMDITQKTSEFYSLWPKKVKYDINNILLAIKNKDFVKFGEVAEHNATTMHALMLTAKPSIDYMTVNTLNDIQTVRFCRNKLNMPIFYTQDAGPNVKLLFLESITSKVKAQFPEVEVIQPFEMIQELV